MNAEFIKVEAEDRIRMRVWERGAGETLACGTGACAVAVVGKLVAGTKDRCTVVLPGGELTIEWAGTPHRPEAPVFLTGPAVMSFDGDFDLEAYR